MNECEVYFGLFGVDFDPSVDTAAIKIDWATAKFRGDPIPKRSSWRCSTGKQNKKLIDVYDMSSALVKRLAPHAQQIFDVKVRFDLEAVLQVVLTVSSDDEIPMPAIGFDQNVLEFLSKVGATIDIDTYRS